jgi:hypothetical protein
MSAEYHSQSRVKRKPGAQAIESQEQKSTAAACTSINHALKVKERHKQNYEPAKLI